MNKLILDKKQISSLIKVLRQVKKLKYRIFKSNGYYTSWEHPIIGTKYQDEKLLMVAIQNDTIVYFDKKENHYDRILTGLDLPEFSATIGGKSFNGLLDFLALCKKYKEEQVILEITEKFLICKVDKTSMKFRIIDPFEEKNDV